jgi:hypothetical protein
MYSRLPKKSKSRLGPLKMKLKRWPSCFGSNRKILYRNQFQNRLSTKTILATGTPCTKIRLPCQPLENTAIPWQDMRIHWNQLALINLKIIVQCLRKLTYLSSLIRLRKT